MTSKLPLFRQEAIDAQQTKWLGDIILIRPISVALLSYLAITLAAVVIAFFIWGSYTKRTTVSGQLLPKNGLLKIYAPQSGIVLEKHVVEGQTVKAGDILYVLSGSQRSYFGDVQSVISEQVKQRQASLQTEIHQTQRLQQLNRSKLLRKIESLKKEQIALESQIVIQHNRVHLAEQTVSRYSGLLATGYISREQLQQKQEVLLDQKSRMQAMQRDLISIDREIAAHDAEVANLYNKDSNQLAALNRSLVSMNQELTENEGKRHIFITAPQAGIATLIFAEMGQSIDTSKPLVSIIPRDVPLQANLYVPSRSIGFIQPGGQVLLRYHAYPHQKFGHHIGTVVSVSKTALFNHELPTTMNISTAGNEPLYRVTVEPENQTIVAYGHDQQLQSGMLIDADILNEKRYLYEWVLEPLYTLSGKI